MLERLLGWFAKSLCLFTQGFKSPFFLKVYYPMLLIKHLSEIKYSAIYITLALFIINVIIWINIDLIILVFSLISKPLCYIPI